MDNIKQLIDSKLLFITEERNNSRITKLNPIILIQILYQLIDRMNDMNEESEGAVHKQYKLLDDRVKELETQLKYYIMNEDSFHTIDYGYDMVKRKNNEEVLK